jgi:hypothetical protein
LSITWTFSLLSPPSGSVSSMTRRFEPFQPYEPVENELGRSEMAPRKPGSELAAGAESSSAIGGGVWVTLMCSGSARALNADVAIACAQCRISGLRARERTGADEPWDPSCRPSCSQAMSSPPLSRRCASRRRRPQMCVSSLERRKHTEGNIDGRGNAPAINSCVGIVVAGGERNAVWGNGGLYLYRTSGQPCLLTNACSLFGDDVYWLAYVQPSDVTRLASTCHVMSFYADRVRKTKAASD